MIEEFIDTLCEFGENIQWYLILTILLTLTVQPIYGQTTITTDIFTVEYSEEFEQPLKIDYVVECPMGTASRSSFSFRLHEGVKTSDDADYYNNIWDRGHLAPVSSFDCTRDTVRETFTYLNVALQHQSLNRGVWRQLEAFENSLALFYEVSITIEVLFDGNPEVLPTGATVPSGFIKILRWSDETAVFYFPNKNTSGTKWTTYLKR